MSRLAVLIVLLIAAACLRGKDAPLQAPGSSSPIDVAKRDYDAIKASRASVEQQKLELPRISPPVLQIASDSLPLGRANPSVKDGDPAKRDPVQDGKSPNWLLDAMYEEPNAATRGGTLALLDEKPDADRLSASTGLRIRRAAARTALNREDRSDRSADREKLTERATNPLDNFMAQWMTAQDYEMLNAASPGSNGGSALDSPTQDYRLNKLGVSPGQKSGAIALVSRGPAVSGPAVLLAAPNANPYMQDALIPSSRFSEPVARAPAAAQVAPPENLQSMQPAAVVAPPAPASKPAEIFKARDDSKYFPQLKRF